MKSSHESDSSSKLAWCTWGRPSIRMTMVRSVQLNPILGPFNLIAA